jgi:hypothetical protein
MQATALARARMARRRGKVLKIGGHRPLPAGLQGVGCGAGCVHFISISSDGLHFYDQSRLRLYSRTTGQFLRVCSAIYEFILTKHDHHRWYRTIKIGIVT